MIAILMLMATMNAVRIQSFGGAEVLRVAEVERPVPAPGELLVRVHAASVNPVDTYTRAGETVGFTGATVPYTPGFDVSGVVETIGEGVTKFRKGDAVFAMLDLRRGGTFELDEVQKAHVQSESGRTRGKIVLVVADSFAPK